MNTRSTNSWRRIHIILGLFFLCVLPLHTWAQSLTFQPIYFKSRKATLDEASKDALKRIAQLLATHPQVTLKLIGHAGIEGKNVDPQALSESRATNALNFLLEEKVKKKRLSALGKGSAELYEPGNPSAASNRRVEFEFKAPAITKKDGKELEKIQLIYWNTLYHALIPITYVKGFFEKEGFDALLIATNHSTINQVKASCGVEPFLKSKGLIFAGAVCGGSPHESIAKGLKIKVIGGLLSGGSMLIAKPEMAKKLRADWNNFRGIRIGRPKGTVLTSMIVSYNAYMRGVDHRKEFKWHLYNSHEEVLEAIARGEIDAGDTYAPLNLRAKEKYGIEEVYNTFELFPFHPCCRIITTPEKLKKDRPKYVRYLKAIIRGHEFFTRFPLKAVDIVQEYTGYTKDEVRISLTNPNFRLNPDPLRNGFIKFWKMMNETGFIHSKENIEDYIDSSVYEDALKKLMEEDPQNPYYSYMMKQFLVQNR